MSLEIYTSADYATPSNENSRMAVAAHVITVTALVRSEDIRRVRDFGAGSGISAPFEHLLSAEVTGVITVGHLVPWALSKDTDGSISVLLAANKNVIDIRHVYNSGTPRVDLVSNVGVEQLTDTWTEAAPTGAKRYFAARSDGVNIVVEVFSDSDRLIQIDNGLTVSDNQTYPMRYVYAQNSLNDASGTVATGKTYDLDLQLPPQAVSGVIKSPIGPPIPSTLFRPRGVA